MGQGRAISGHKDDPVEEEDPKQNVHPNQKNFDYFD
jgi:hypothetical protein